MTIRDFNISDLTEVASVYDASKVEELKNEPIHFSLPPIISDQQRLAKLLESNIYVYDDNNLLGFAAVHNDEIRGLFVKPEFLGQGVGEQLLQFILAQHSLPLHLSVVKSNISAITLYKKYGFEIARDFDAAENDPPILVCEMVRKHPSASTVVNED